ncbi:histidine kinase [Kitasatospora sp. MAP5-34]|uniref:sensor histidine kinase n=1 Tax=Kitasatospora sp. MAP5-34 TaxID=3035102 RepID=UPI002473BEC7|nr:histidine kinase [Kitasatospora sp. MAP5-34]MDH6575672.1 signal transduction histidine kinase [Kitasatospora sp. MAP5-34]
MPKFCLSPRQEDRTIALAGLVGGLLLTVVGAYDRAAAVPAWVMVLPFAGMAGLELLRRTRTVWTVSVGGLLFAANVFVGSNLATVVMYTDLLYAGVLYGSRRMSKILHLTGGASTLVLSTLTLLYATVAQALLVAGFAALVFLAPVWTADLLREHRERADTERLRAEQTALLAELDRREAVVAERARMARELHDVVANHLSAIAIHATGAQSLARRQRRDTDDPLLAAMAVIRENSVQGLAEMRRMIDLLRARDETSYEAPKLDALDTLLAQAGAAGEAAGLAFEAAEDGVRGELPAPVELAAYRIVQESLTNALKHAAPGIVRLGLTYRPERIEIAVDSPYRASAGAALPGARAGLVGMGERAGLLGGSFEAGPDGGCWHVRAVLPREPGGAEVVGVAGVAKMREAS